MDTRCLALATLALILSFSGVRAETRSFIDQAGRALEGELIAVNGDMVTIKRTSDGQVFTVKANTFSMADQKYFASKGGAAPAVPATVGPVTAKPSPPAPTTTAASAAPMRIELKVYPNKNDKSKNNYFDDRMQRVSYRIDVRNTEQQRALSGGKVTVMVFAEDLGDRTESIVVSREEFDVNLQPVSSTSLETKESKLVYDNAGYKYGHKYSGYMVVLRGSDGKTIQVNASSPTVAKFAEDALKLNEHDVFDKRFKFLKKGYLKTS